MTERVAIVGWAMSRFDTALRHLHREELVHGVVMDLYERTGLGPDAVDFVCDASDDILDGLSISNTGMIEAAGAFLKEETKIEEDGAFAALHAYQRLRVGTYRTALVVAHGKVSESSAVTYSNTICEPFYQRPLGLESITAHALQAQRFVEAKRATAEDAADWVVRAHANGLRNPHAHAARALTADDVMKSRPVASPLRLHDCPPLSDGAAALLLAVESEATKISKTPIWIDGLGLSHDLHYIGHRDLAEGRSVREAAERAYAMAGIRRASEELDVAEVCGHFSYQDLMLLECLGLCETGGAGAFARSGRFPVNPSGGALCADPIMVAGLVRLIEAARQLAGQAGEHQVPGNLRRALAHASSGLCLQSNVVFVLQKGA